MYVLAFEEKESTLRVSITSHGAMNDDTALRLVCCLCSTDSDSLVFKCWLLRFDGRRLERVVAD